MKKNKKRKNSKLNFSKQNDPIEWATHRSTLACQALKQQLNDNVNDNFNDLVLLSFYYIASILENITEALTLMYNKTKNIP